MSPTPSPPRSSTPRPPSARTGTASAPRAASGQRAPLRAVPRTTPVPAARKPPARRPAARRPAPAARKAPRGPRAGRPQRRTAVLLAIVLAVGAVFTGRLLQLQVVDSAPLAAAALEGRFRTVTLPAQRGSITDRNGEVLAESVERRTVVADPDAFRAKPDNPDPWSVEEAAAALAPVLGTSEAELVPLLTPRQNDDDVWSRWVILKKGLTPEQWRAVDAVGVPGVSSDPTQLRTYPAGTTAGNLIGFTSKDGATALAGIELAEDGTLTGTNGSVSFEQGLNGQRIPLAGSSTTAPVDGKGLQLTIDEDLQFYAQQAAVAQAAKTQAAWAAVVVMTKTGEVRALAESGSIDPADPGATPEAERHNRSLEDVFEPGSTGKVITAAAALQEGLATPDTPLVVPDRLQLPNRAGTVKDSHDHAPQKLTLAGVMAESSNVGTVMVGQKLTTEQRYDYLRAFGIGEKQLGLPGETRGLLRTPDEWGTRDSFNILFGQAYSVNALQAAQVYSTIANDGVRIPPHVVAGTTDDTGTFTPAAEPVGTQVVSKSTAEQVTSMLEGVVSSEGTGQNAAVPGFRVAGKTGTAQDLPASTPGHPEYTASFIGMAPAEDPQLVVAVIVQHPDYAYRYGGTAAAPVFADVMQYALAREGIAPSGAAPSLVPLTWK